MWKMYLVFKNKALRLLEKKETKQNYNYFTK